MKWALPPRAFSCGLGHPLSRLSSAELSATEFTNATQVRRAVMCSIASKTNQELEFQTVPVGHLKVSQTRTGF